MHETTFLNEASFEAFLGDYPFVRVDDRLLFFHEEQQQYVIAKLDGEGDYSANDFFQLPEGTPYQLINGKFILNMPPSIQHQRISMNLLRQIDNYVFEKQLGEVFHPPTSIVLGEKNVFEPDILYISVARKSQIGENRITGAPEFVVEILSKSTEGYDRSTKMTKYGEYDVVEYWLVHPNDEFIEVYHNEEQQMQLVQTAKAGDVITSKAIDGFVLEVGKVF